MISVEQISSAKTLSVIAPSLSDQPFFFFLDTSLRNINSYRPEKKQSLWHDYFPNCYSYLAYAPLFAASVKNNEFSILHNELAAYRPTSLTEVIRDFSFDAMHSYPFFVGGAVISLGYESHLLEDRVVFDNPKVYDTPDISIAVYDSVLIEDHHEKRIYHAYTDKYRSVSADVYQQVLDSENEANLSCDISSPQALMSEELYLDRVEKIRSHIKDGDIYQANFTHTFECDFAGSPFSFYDRLRTANAAPYSAYLSYPDFVIASSSPELFLKKQDSSIYTRPIKGTRPRGQTLNEDLEQVQALYASEKDRAELSMIIDLERNDLGRICQSGTVEVLCDYEVEEFAKVYHLTSTIKGELKNDLNLLDVLANTFPGGSITGAPKLRAMQIIEDMEINDRGIYTGSIGYLDWSGDFSFNIAIRTPVIKDAKLYYSVGGAIIYDSAPKAEYQESLDKAQGMLAAWS